MSDSIEEDGEGFYRPSPDTLAAMVIGYLRLHPSRTLTREDVELKFDSIDTGPALRLLQRAIKNLHLRFDGELFRLGPVPLPSNRLRTSQMLPVGWQFDLTSVQQAPAMP